jgi:hypothetical protein
MEGPAEPADDPAVMAEESARFDDVPRPPGLQPAILVGYLYEGDEHVQQVGPGGAAVESRPRG